MWLLDVNVPAQLVGLLAELGEQARTAKDQGWGGLVNGALVEAAVAGGFTCVLTRDRLFGEAASRALRRFPQFSVVLLDLPQLRAQQFLQEFRATWSRAPIRPESGRFTSWPRA